MSKFKVSQKSDQNTTWVFWVVMCFVSLSLIIAPFYRALFNGGQFLFERPIFVFTTWTAVALVAISIYMFKHWKMNSQKDLMAIAVWLIPLTYLISMLNAASYYSAIQEVYLHIVYAVFFLIGAYFSRSALGAAILQYGLIGSGYVIVVHGLLNWFRNVHYEEAVLLDQLSGVFQYPNTYAAYLIGLLIVALIFINNSNKWYMTVPHAFMLVPIMVSMLLTLSRGGMIILPLMVLLYLVWIPWRKQLFVLLYLALAGGVGLAIYNQLTSIQIKLSQQFDSSESLKGWAIVIAVSLIVAVITFLIQTYIAIPQSSKDERNKIFYKHNFVVPLCVMVLSILGAILVFGNNSLTDQLPKDVRERLQSINIEDISIASRAEFYKDSFAIAKDYPLIGAGGSAWASLYNQYKSFPYTSAQTHNVISQVLVDTGIIGLLVFVMFIGLCWYIFIRSIKKRQFTEWNEKKLVFPLFGLTILLHGLLDFDLSFVYLSALLYLSLGVLVSHSENETNSKQISLKAEKTAKIYPAITAIIAVVVFINAFQAFRADKFFMNAQKAATTTHNYEDIIRPLDKALALNQKHPHYNLFKASVLIDVFRQTNDEKYGSEATAILQKMHKSEPNNSQMNDLQYNLLLFKKEYSQAADWLEFQITTNPWDVNLYEKAITLNFELGYQAFLQSDNDLKDKYWERLLADYERFTDKLNEYHALPKSLQSGYAFEVPPRMVLNIGKIYYLNQDYLTAEKVLRGQISQDIIDQTRREIARWYIATRLKQNLEDNSGLYELLKRDGPEDEEEIKQILNLTR